MRESPLVIRMTRREPARVRIQSSTRSVNNARAWRMIHSTSARQSVIAAIEAMDLNLAKPPREAALMPLHHRSLGGLLVIKTEQMQRAVGGEKEHLVSETIGALVALSAEPLTHRGSLARGGVEADDDVSQQRHWGDVLQIILDGEAQHISHFISVAPLPIQLTDAGVIDELHIHPRPWPPQLGEDRADVSREFASMNPQSWVKVFNVNAWHRGYPSCLRRSLSTAVGETGRSPSLASLDSTVSRIPSGSAILVVSLPRRMRRAAPSR